MVEDAAFEPLQRGARLEAQFFDEHRARPLVGAQCFGLPAGAVERQDPLCVQTLTQWMLRDEHLEFADQVVLPAEREVAVDSVHQRDDARLVESLDLVAIDGLQLDPRERAAAPQRERLRVDRRGSLEGCGVRLRARLDRQRREPRGVELVAGDLDQVAGWSCRDRPGAVAAERLAQLRDIAVHRLDRGRGRRLAPQLIDQPLPGHDLVRMQEQNAEHRPVLQRPKRNLPTLEEHHQRTENPKLHPLVLPRPSSD